MWPFRRQPAGAQSTKSPGAVEAHPFANDRPIGSSGEDRLNRKAFAFSIADAIGRWRHRDSLVVGVFGPWGVGKTSIVNMTKERLTATLPKPLIVDFSPWEWAGHQELAEAFFEEVEKVLPHHSSPRAAEAAAKVRKYALALQTSATVAKAVPIIVAAISVAGVTVGIGLGEVNDSVAKWGGRSLVLIGLAGVVLSQSQTVMASLAEYLQKLSSRSKQTLSGVKSELGDALRELDAPIVIVVDDIDRLTPADTVRMLQIIKANSDLPGIVFLLAFDQEAVAKSVRAALSVDGRGYLEKVVQVGFDVPAPDAAELGQLLIDAVNKAIAPKPIDGRFNNTRWRDVYVRGLLPYLTTPRRVIRFGAMAEFGLSRHLDGEECNVDPVDFLGVEALREFEPAVYEALRNSKDAVTGMTSGDTHSHRTKAGEVAPLLQIASASSNGDATERLLRTLFPSIEWAISNVGQGVNRDRQLEDRRVAHERIFDRYFQFTVPTRDLSDGELVRILALAEHSKDELVKAFRELMARGHMIVFLIRVQGAPDKVSLGSEPIFMAALFDVGDQLPNRVETLLDVSELLLAEFLVESLLERHPPAERVPIFRAAMNASDGVILPIEVVRLQMHRHERDRSPAIAQSELEQLLSELVDRVVALSESGNLLSHRHLAPLLYAWDQVEPGAPRPWAEEQAAQRAGLVRLIVAFDRIAGEDGRHPLVRFIDLELAKKRARQWLEDSDLETGEREALEALLAPPSRWEMLRRTTPEIDGDEEPKANGDPSRDAPIAEEEPNES